MSYFSGQGKVYISKRDAFGVPAGFALLGNCSSLGVSPGRAAERYAVQGGEPVRALALGGDMPAVQLVMDDCTKENYERVLYGLSSVIAAATATDEIVIAALGKTVPLSKMNIAAWTYLKNSGLSVTYVKDVDYSVNAGGGSLNFPAAGSAIVNAQSLRATYDYGAHEKIGAFTTAPAFYWLRFEGVNTLNGNPVVADFYKVKFGPADSFPIIGDDFTRLVISAFVQYDDLQPDNQTDGRFFRIRQA